jgi:hypothetical protein
LYFEKMGCTDVGGHKNEWGQKEKGKLVALN